MLIYNTIPCKVSNMSSSPVHFDVCAPINYLLFSCDLLDFRASAAAGGSAQVWKA